MLMLERKGIPYKRVDLMPVISKGILKAQRFPGVTVPALKLNGRRVQGSREIGRELDRIQPEPRSLSRRPRAPRQGRGGGGAGATSSSRSRAASAGGRSSGTAPPMASYSEGRASVCRSASPSRRADRSWRSRRA